MGTGKLRMKYLKYVVGEAAENSLPSDLDVAITKMTKGEVAMVTVSG